MAQVRASNIEQVGDKRMKSTEEKSRSAPRITSKYQTCWFIFILLLAVLEPAARDSRLASAAPATASGQRATGEQALNGESLEFPPAVAGSDGSYSSGTRQLYYAAGAPAAKSSKRARKLSAFMPMRGRRTGLQADEAWSLPNREDDDELAGLELSALRSALARQVLVPAGARPLPIQPSGFVLQHLQHSRPMQHDSYGDSQLLETKSRRASHPMRGKNSLDNLTDLDQLASTNDQQTLDDPSIWAR